MWVLTYSLLMLAERGVDDTHVEQDLARVCDLVKLAEGIVELVVVVASEGRYPGLDFLQRVLAAMQSVAGGDNGLTSFNDMVLC